MIIDYIIADLQSRKVNLKLAWFDESRKTLTTAQN